MSRHIATILGFRRSSLILGRYLIARGYFQPHTSNSLFRLAINFLNLGTGESTKSGSSRFPGRFDPIFKPQRCATPATIVVPPRGTPIMTTVYWVSAGSIGAPQKIAG